MWSITERVQNIKKSALIIIEIIIIRVIITIMHFIITETIISLYYIF